MKKEKNEKVKKMKKWKKLTKEKRRKDLLNQNLNDQVSKNWYIAYHLTLIFKLDATVFILLKFDFHF